MAPVPLLVLTGPIGVGKTTVAYEASELLTAGRVPHAMVDFDALTECWPRPPDDPFNVGVGLRNLAAVWDTYRRAGAGRLVLAAVVERRERLHDIGQAVPGAVLTVVRLRAPEAVLRRRVRRRTAGAALRWHLDRAALLARRLDEAQIEDHLVDAGGPPVEVARAVLRAVGWPHGERGRA